MRIIDLGYCETMANGFRATQGRPMFEPRFPIMSESGGEELKALAAKKDTAPAAKAAEVVKAAKKVKVAPAKKQAAAGKSARKRKGGKKGKSR